MADNDDKREDGAGKKTLTLKGAPNLGGRPGMSRSSRSTVVVEKRTRVVPGQRPGTSNYSSGSSSASSSPRPHPSQPSGSSPRPQPPPSAPGRPNGGLSATESDARARVLGEASARQQ